ncbi:MAG: hypothetical protein R3A80_12745 [Bdellovibrionota bacterium]
MASAHEEYGVITENLSHFRANARELRKALSATYTEARNAKTLFVLKAM